MEAFPIQDKRATTIAKILVNEIFNRYSSPLQLISEFVNNVLQEITELGHIHHFKSSPYNPKANGKCEASHKVLNSCLSKLADKTSWNEAVPSLISAFNSSVSGTSKFSPYLIVFHRDPILPIDTILRPSEVYYGDQFLPKSLETMHKSYYLVRQRLKRQALNNKMYYNKRNRVQDIMFEVGDSVYLKNNQKQGKLDSNWIPHFRILQQTGSSSYIVQHQVT